MAALEEETCVRGLLLAGHIEEVKGGNTIFFKGDPARNAYRVIRGQVNLFAPVDDGSKVIFNELEPPSLFGINSTLFGGFYRLSAEAVTDCTLLAMSARVLEQQMARDPEFGIEVIQTIAARIRLSEERKNSHFLKMRAWTSPSRSDV